MQGKMLENVKNKKVRSAFVVLGTSVKFSSHLMKPTWKSPVGTLQFFVSFIW